jgi:hypothetical protein
MLGRSLVGRGVSAVLAATRTLRAPCGVLALLVVVAPVSVAARGKPTSCPLATRVHPFEATTLSRYDVTVTDGSSGDVDGSANGTCHLDIDVCVASGECVDEHLTGVRVRSRGRAPAAARAEAAKLLTDALAALPGGTLIDGTRIDFGDTPPSPGTCTHARLELAAEQSTKKSRAMALEFSTKAVDDLGNRLARRSRLGLRCVAAGGDGGKTPTCRASRGQCPEPAAPSCGNGRRDGGAEACDGGDDALCPGACRADCSCPAQASPDNVAPQAVVQASSDQAASPALAAVDGSVGGGAHEWIADGEPNSATLRLIWPAPVTVDRVVLYDRVSTVDNILAATLVSDDGHAVAVGPLPPDGRPVEIMLGTRTILALTLSITASSGANAGLAEIQVLAAQAQPPTNASPPSNPSPPSTPPPPAGKGTTYYLSPAGSDSNAGTTPDHPWHTFGKILNPSKPLRAGDVVVLLDGTYTPDTTGLPHIVCGDGGNAPNGTAERSITISAANERKALLQSDGHTAGLTMEGCSWWNLQGLQAASRDATNAPQDGGYPFRFSKVDHVTLRRLLGSHNNRQENTHIFAVEDSTNVLFEECEAYFFHRHAFSIWRSRFVTLRRCYANSMLYGARGCCSSVDNRAYGDDAFSLYGTSDSIVENSISENQANGFQIHGIENDLDPSGSGGRNNRILGSLSFGDSLPMLIGSRAGGGAYHNAKGNQVRDFVVANTSGSCIYVRGAAGTLVENATLYHSTGSGGLFADGGDPEVGGSCGPTNPDGCSLTARNVLSLGHSQGYGFMISGFDNWLIEWSNATRNSIDYGSSEPPDDATGRIQHSTRVAAPEIGLDSGQCLLWIPEGSALKNAGKDGHDIGATIVNRYNDGVLTNRPLWDPVTGAFPCGAVVAGINDGPIRCTNIHTRLNVNTNGCRLPAAPR